MRRALYVLLVLTAASLLRLYPTLISGMPFSTDSWPPIRNTELLVEHTPIDLGNGGIFDGYNNYWPANSIFGAVLSQVVCVEPKNAMAIVFPVIGAVAVLIFYTLVEGVFDASTSLIASTIFATAFTHAIFTAGVTKETYGNPLYLLLILLFLKPKGRVRAAFLFALTAAALVLTHHFTPAVTVAILFSMALACFVSEFRKGSVRSRFSFFLVGILASATVFYYLVYAGAGFNIQLTLSDWLSAASFQTVAFALAALFAFKKSKHSGMHTMLACSMATAVPLAIALLAAKTSITPGAPVLPSRYLVYAAPLVIASPLIVLGYGEVKSSGSGSASATLFWLAAVLGLEGYAIFGCPDLGLGLAYRTVNFLWAPLALLSAVGLQRLYLTSKGLHGWRPVAGLAKTATVAAVAAIALLNIFNVYAAVSLGERYMGYFWLYTSPEYEAGSWVATAASRNLTIAGDVKASYLLKGYFNVEVDVFQGLKYLAGRGDLQQQLLWIYGQMLRNGYVLYEGYSVDLPQNWTEKLYGLNLLYSDGSVKIFGG